MIRLFTIFCKLELNKLSDKKLFFIGMKNFSTKNLPFIKIVCPNCGAKKPTWTYHDSYSRYLISYENHTVATENISITQIICSSCRCTHAILPEIIVPHNSHSLLFILRVLRDYFLRTITVAAICEKYQISVATLYRWKNLFLSHKQLWFGVVQNMYQDVRYFLCSIPSLKTSKELENFFKENSHSFLQGSRKTANCDTG